MARPSPAATSRRWAVSLTASRRPAGSTTRVIDALARRNDQIALSGRSSQPQRALAMTPPCATTSTRPSGCAAHSWLERAPHPAREARHRLAAGSRMVHRGLEPAPVVLPVPRLHGLEGAGPPSPPAQISRSSSRGTASRPSRSAHAAAVSRARLERARVERVEPRVGEPGGERRRPGRGRAPTRGASSVPWKRRSEFQVDSPWRTSQHSIGTPTLAARDPGRREGDAASSPAPGPPSCRRSEDSPSRP